MDGVWYRVHLPEVKDAPQLGGCVMQVGDLVRLTCVTGGSLGALLGIVLKIHRDGFHKVLWTDGDVTQEFPKNLEVVCK